MVDLDNNPNIVRWVAQAPQSSSRQAVFYGDITTGATIYARYDPSDKQYLKFWSAKFTPIIDLIAIRNQQNQNNSNSNN